MYCIIRCTVISGSWSGWNGIFFSTLRTVGVFYCACWFALFLLSLSMLVLFVFMYVMLVIAPIWTYVSSHNIFYVFEIKLYYYYYYYYLLHFAFHDLDARDHLCDRLVATRPRDLSNIGILNRTKCDGTIILLCKQLYSKIYFHDHFYKLFLN